MNAYSTDRFSNQTAFIALVTGTPETGLGWKASLARHGLYHTKVVIAQSDAIDAVDPDLWIVDSIDTLRHLRPRTQLPILASISSRTPELEICAFDIGADDCVLSNASVDELALRVGRLLRRAERPGEMRPMLITVDAFEKRITDWANDDSAAIGIAELSITPLDLRWALLDHRKVAAVQTTLWSRIARQLPEGAIVCRDGTGSFRIATKFGGIRRATEIAEAAKTDITSAPLCLLISTDEVRVTVLADVTSYPPKEPVANPDPQIASMATHNDVLVLENPVQAPAIAEPKEAAPSDPAAVQTAEMTPTRPAPAVTQMAAHLENAPLSKGDGSMLSVLHSRAAQVGVAA